MKQRTPIPDLAGLATRALMLLAVVAVVMAGGVVVAMTRSVPSTPEPSAATAPMVAVAPGGILDPSSVDESLHLHYVAAEEHPDAFAAVHCYCGCDAFLGHRNLLDCFIRPDGTGWEAHAAGCGVCLGEAAQVEELIAAGVTGLDEIRAAVDAQWGDPYQTS